MFFATCKHFQRKNFFAVTLLLLFITPLLSSCASSLREAKGVTVIKQSACCAHPNVAKVAVIDFFELSAEHGKNEPHVCPITGLNFIPGKVQKGAGETVAALFRQQLRKKGFIVSDPEQVQRAMENKYEKYSEEFCLALGRKVGADLVFMGTVMRFEEMVGTKIGSEKPASVSFSVALVSVPSGKTIWKAKFEKTQKSFFDNMLDFETFFKGGMVWQKAEKLADIGIQNVLERLPFKPAKRKSDG